MLIPKISNFLWSKNLYAGRKTSVYPEITIPHNEMIWKRWHDPDRLLSETSFESLLPPSDIYSLGLLFWEIAWCKAKNLPFKKVPVKNLHNHLQKKQEEMPADIPKEYQLWKDIVNKMCRFKSEERYDIGSVEMIMGKLRSMSLFVSTNATV